MLEILESFFKNDLPHTSTQILLSGTEVKLTDFE